MSRRLLQPLLAALMLQASMQFAIAAPGNLSGDTKASAEVWSTFQARNRSLDVLRKDEGGWRIIRSINYPEKH